jgi:hypothetical protein
MKNWIISLFLLTSAVSSAADPISTPSEQAAETQVSLQEDIMAIETILEAIVIKAQEKSKDRFFANSEKMHQFYYGAALKFSKTKALMADLNQRIFLQYPEMAVIDPLVRIVRAFTLTHYLISIGHPAWALVTPMIPDVEIFDIIYFKLRNWLRRKKFQATNLYPQKELEKFRENLLTDPSIKEKDIENLLGNPQLIRNLLVQAPNKQRYQNILDFSTDGAFLFHADAPLDAATQNLVAIDVLIIRLELDGAYNDPGLPLQAPLSLVKDWFKTWKSRRVLYKKVRELQKFQWRYLGSMKAELDMTPLNAEFSKLRSESLDLLENYQSEVQAYQVKMKSGKPRGCAEQLGSGEK